MRALQRLRWCPSRQMMSRNSSSSNVRFVQDIFTRVSNKYDVMNDVMSGGIHRLWKDLFVQRLAPTSETRLLDVAGGTGDISFRFLRYLLAAEREISLSNVKVSVCDLNPDMLAVGRRREIEQGYAPAIKWIEGNAESLPLDDNSFDAYTIAFGIRNVSNIPKALREAYRVLVPGGRFMCLEFSRVKNPLLQRLYTTYSFEIIPILGEIIAEDKAAYRYLVDSIAAFPDQDTFAEMIREAGFKAVNWENLSGGIAAIHSAYKFADTSQTAQS
ncbi:ubiquinone/menaquinone biosynthesis C-methyltransferase UbiE-like isoform X2 [Oscarella lobularis]|uniref:ubiquinone/menaquinone biosynthesis C-methyltransferase UbiE-like isoform X2 n=1 Tax=Oscarella lobularis TaxID=121494 RepID=UPI0033133FF5